MRIGTRVGKVSLPRALWTGVLILTVSIIISFWWPFPAARLLPAAPSVMLVLLSFACGYVDATLGMGYGSTLTPLLLLLGYQPLEVVPAIIASQLSAGGIAAWAHHYIGNVDLHPKNRAFRIACLLASTSVLGTSVGALVALYLPALYLQAWVGFLVCAIGITTIALNRRHFPFSWKRIVSLGIFASFNKGSTGGGYGPIVMGGQLLAGVGGKDAGDNDTCREPRLCRRSHHLLPRTRGSSLAPSSIPYCRRSGRCPLFHGHRGRAPASTFERCNRDPHFYAGPVDPVEGFYFLNPSLPR